VVQCQYDTLMTQIDRFNVTVVADNGDYNVSGNQQLADAVTANIDQSVDFLTPRAQAMSTAQDFAGDTYFRSTRGRVLPALAIPDQCRQRHQGSPARLVLRARRWQRALKWGSRIDRSHVCR